MYLVNIQLLCTRYTCPIPRSERWHVWQEVSRKVYQRQYSNVAELKTAILEAWKAIPPEFCQKLFASVPSRLEAVLSAKGYATKY